MAKQSKKPAYRDGDEMIVPSAASLGTGKLSDEEFGEKPIPSQKQTPPKAGQSAVGRRSSQALLARQSFATVTGLTCCTLATRSVARRVTSRQRRTLNFPPKSCFGLILPRTRRPVAHSDRADRDVNDDVLIRRLGVE
jgi:hypothetical protein